MRFSIMLVGETEEPLETREAARDLLYEFASKLRNIGYMVSDADLDFGEPHLPGDITEMFEVVDDDVDGWDALPEPTLAEKVRMLRNAAGNKIVSQRELAEAFGVTRYQIRKILEDE